MLPVPSALLQWATLFLTLFVVHDVAFRWIRDLPNAGTPSNAALLEIASSAPVVILVCMEALCPDCKNFMNDHLLQTYELLGPEIMDVHLIPFGNARIDVANKTVHCQHGVGECDANSYEQCIIQVFRDPGQYLPMIHCLYNELPMGFRPEIFDPVPFETCANQSHLEFSRIQECHDNPHMAWKVMQRAANATPTYHDHVPWIEINGVFMNEETHVFVVEVCKAYMASGGSSVKCDHFLDHLGMYHALIA